MTDSFPFKIKFVNGAQYGSPEQMYQIAANFAELNLAIYKSLFARYSPNECLISLVDIIWLIIKENAPDLLARLEFDEEGYLLDVYIDSKEALQEFIASICPVYQNVNKLEEYTKRVAHQA